MSKSKRIVLASTSPFRKKLMDDASISCEIAPALGDEKSVSGFPPEILAAKRAEFKALDVARRSQAGSLIIGADQVLSLAGRSFDKAETSEEAITRLTEFQGRTHFLHSGICFVQVHPSGMIETVFETVVNIPMEMRPLSLSEITKYVATEEWQGCVGCYRIEGEGRHLFTKIGGDQSAVIGLPMLELKKALSLFQ
jgi:septum formation protein